MAAKQQTISYSMWPKPDFADVVLTKKDYRSSLNGALLFAHYEMSASDLKKEVVKYLKSIDVKHPLLDRIKDINENRFITYGKYMYILNHKGDVPEDILVKLLPSMEKTIEDEEARLAAKEKEDKLTSVDGTDEVPKIIISIQDRLREKSREVAGEIEGWIDDFCANKKASPKTVEDFVNLFKTYELKAPHMRHMQAIFERRANEVYDAVAGEDKELTEGYSNFTKPELKKYELFHRNLFKACEMLQDVAKNERAPRKKKPVSQEKLVAKLKYKKDDSTLGIVSMNPVHIIGAKEVWVYNTKTKKLAQYKAMDERGLLVKGASLENYSSESAEKTLRKPADTLTEFKKASKVKLRTFLKELTTVDVPCGGKLNEHHVILRIDK
jgi:hypothetical protein